VSLTDSDVDAGNIDRAQDTVLDFSAGQGDRR
jgi:hypothetical protein